MKILVNADDFGYDENRSSAILEAFARSLLTTTTAMPNRPYFDKAMRCAAKRNLMNCIGLHFNITEGLPMTEQMRECNVFCDDEGRFTADFHRRLKSRIILPNFALEAIKVEAKAQIEKFLDYTGVLMHLDSHHHVHTNFSVAHVLFPLARRYGFKSTRMSRTIPRRLPFIKKAYKTVFNAYANRMLPFVVNEFTDFADFKKYYSAIPRDAIVEVMVHPEFIGDKLIDAKDEMSKQQEFWDRVKVAGVCLKGCYD